MAAEYKKTTRNDINFPLYCLDLINGIKEIVDGDKNAKEVVLYMNQPYCFDAIDLVTRTFHRKGIWLNKLNYRLIKSEGCETRYCYKWEVSRLDDLPF